MTVTGSLASGPRPGVAVLANDPVLRRVWSSWRRDRDLRDSRRIDVHVNVTTDTSTYYRNRSRRGSGCGCRGRCVSQVLDPQLHLGAFRRGRAAARILGDDLPVGFHDDGLSLDGISGIVLEPQAFKFVLSLVEPLANFVRNSNARAARGRRSSREVLGEGQT